MKIGQLVVMWPLIKRAASPYEAPDYWREPVPGHVPMHMARNMIRTDPTLTLQERLALYNMLNAAGAQSGKGKTGLVSTGDFARAAVGAAAGGGVGWATGKLLGALLGITPKSQRRLRDVGALGGILRATGIWR